MLTSVRTAFSDDISIDLGTANTLVHVAGRGIVINEPSLVVVQTRGGQREVLAVGQKARDMIGRTPEPVEAIKPLRDGVIADFLAAEEMLRQFIKRTKTMLGFRRPRILICVPAGATPVERRAVFETAKSVGARKVYLVEEPVAASMGAGLPIDKPGSFMVVDIGGGTTDIAVLSRRGVVQARSLKCAGNAMDAAIVRYIRRSHHLLIGEQNAERIKIQAGSASSKPGGRRGRIHIKGRDVKQGRQKSIVLTPENMAEALDDPIQEIAEFIERALEDLPSDVLGEVRERGIYLTGGGALLHGLDTELESRAGVRFTIPENPMECVVAGSAMILDEIEDWKHLLVEG